MTIREEINNIFEASFSSMISSSTPKEGYRIVSSPEKIKAIYSLIGREGYSKIINGIKYTVGRMSDSGKLAVKVVHV